MSGLIETAISNTLVVIPLAVLARLLSGVRASPALVHSLWLLALVKLLTPPLVRVPMLSLPEWVRADAEVVAAIPADVDGCTEADELPETECSEPWAGNEFLPAAGRGDPLPAPEGLGVETAPGDPLHAAEGPGLIGSVDEASPTPAPTLGGPGVFAPGSRAVPRIERSGRTSEGVWLGRLQRGVLILWIGGAVLSLGWCLRQVVRFRRGLRTMRDAPRRWQRQAEILARRLGLRRSPSLRVTEHAVSPMVWCFLGRPRVIVPAVLLERLDPDEVRTLLAHELAHVRRKDHWTRHLELLVRIVHWWNPVAWWACRELRAAEEECCDAWVTTVLPRSRRAYTEALISTAEFLGGPRSSVPAAASGLGRFPELKRRLKMIVRGHTSRSLSIGGRIGVCAASLALIPLLPVSAQDDVATQDAASATTTAAPAVDPVSVGASTAVASSAPSFPVATTAVDPAVASLSTADDPLVAPRVRGRAAGPSAPTADNPFANVAAVGRGAGGGVAVADDDEVRRALHRAMILLQEAGFEEDVQALGNLLAQMQPGLGASSYGRPGMAGGGGGAPAVGFSNDSGSVRASSGGGRARRAPGTAGPSGPSRAGGGAGGSSEEARPNVSRSGFAGGGSGVGPATGSRRSSGQFPGGASSSDSGYSSGGGDRIDRLEAQVQKLQQTLDALLEAMNEGSAPRSGRRGGGVGR